MIPHRIHYNILFTEQQGCCSAVGWVMEPGSCKQMCYAGAVVLWELQAQLTVYMNVCKQNKKTQQKKSKFFAKNKIIFILYFYSFFVNFGISIWSFFGFFLFLFSFILIFCCFLCVLLIFYFNDFVLEKQLTQQQRKRNERKTTRLRWADEVIGILTYFYWNVIFMYRLGWRSCNVTPKSC